MTRSRTLSAAARPPYHRASFILAMMAAIALFIMSMAVHAADDKDKDNGLSDEDMACLKCHSKPGQEKTLGNGEKLSLFIGTKAFAESAHHKEGCEGCHSEIDEKTHGKEKTSIASKRAQALSMMDACRDCHKKTFKQYEDSVHAALVQDGSEKAPLCSDCHNPHTTRTAKSAPAASSAVICQKCHEKIDKAFTASVHGQSAGDDELACADCHRTHNVKAASLGNNMKKECISCHRDTASTHSKWLPNTERHLEAISCPACHSPGAKRRVNLRLYDGMTQQQASDKVGVPQFIKLAGSPDANSSLDARALWSMLQEFNSNGGPTKTVLRGRLEVKTGVEAHQMAKKEQALKDCDTCHSEGAEPFQSVTVSIAGPDGRPVRRDASKGILNSVESIESVGGFYAIGSTRIKLLDTLLVLTVAAGILLPGAHLTAKWLFRRARAKQETDAGRSADESTPN
ncbi:MAG TPA: cytochrome c3 family protein [Noviherbaspirillum sp.]|uniref:cytochrome c3 family protein n=1 Tax=Noviherbaspirillum sp. TaxID=1926288 RepID=UPI002B46ACE3|nr:cytochrome c3 family protein [Noviherbaspirillum sp.]HJV88413.1 cytochrome c3 family protein [Noviherbaspirillum sp.]